MTPRCKLVITDLDNTLYDWVTFFAKAFAAMIDELEQLLQTDREKLLREFKSVHQRYGTSEQPFAVFELESVRQKFPNATRVELKTKLDTALHAFNSARKRTLMLYDGVEATLALLKDRGVVVVGHTESIAVNGYYRLKRLAIEPYFHHLYALEGHVAPHPNIARERELAPPEGFLSVIPTCERKPNPRLLLDICSREGIQASDAVYVGDSLTRDVGMAKEAGVTAVWAKYGTLYDRNLWGLLVQITHWTNADVAREEELSHRYDMIEPDYTLDCFSQLISIVIGDFAGKCGGNGSPK
jgi:FMN phosphatase YigB (HAD superfamily)